MLYWYHNVMQCTTGTAKVHKVKYSVTTVLLNISAVTWTWR